MNKRNRVFTLDEVYEFVIKNSKSILLSKKYERSSSPLVFKCYCGEIFETSFAAFKVGKRQCDKCGYINSRGKQSLNSKDVINKIKKLQLKINFDKFDYKNAHSKIFLFCTSCSKEYSTSWASLSQGLNKECRKCLYKKQGKKRRLDVEHIKKYLKKFGLTFLNKEDEYKNNATKIKIMCKCGNIYGNTWSHLQRNEGIRCPSCSNSNRESILARSLKDYCVNNFETEIEYKILKNPKSGRWLPYDIYLSEYKLFIEVHGTQHYYETKFFGGKKELENRKKLDKIKKNFAISNGYFLEISTQKVKDFETAKNILISKIKEIKNGQY